MLIFGYIKSNNTNPTSQESFPQTDANAAQEVKTATQIELENTNNPEKLSQYGNELAHAENYESSIKYFDKSLSIKYNETVLNMKANALLQLQNNEGAMECADAVLRNNSTNAGALDLKGRCYLKLDKFDQSIEYFDRSLSIKYNENVLLHKSSALFQLYDYEGAMECADDILKNNSTNTNALGMKAISLARLGDYDQASKYIDMAVESDPDNLKLLEIKDIIASENNVLENSIQDESDLISKVKLDLTKMGYPNAQVKLLDQIKWIEIDIGKFESTTDASPDLRPQFQYISKEIGSSTYIIESGYNRVSVEWEIYWNVEGDGTIGTSAHGSQPQNVYYDIKEATIIYY